MAQILITKKENQNSIMMRMLGCQRRTERASQDFTDSMHLTLKHQKKMDFQIYLIMLKTMIKMLLYKYCCCV